MLGKDEQARLQLKQETKCINKESVYSKMQDVKGCKYGDKISTSFEKCRG